MLPPLAFLPPVLFLLASCTNSSEPSSSPSTPAMSVEETIADEPPSPSEPQPTSTSTSTTTTASITTVTTVTTVPADTTTTPPATTPPPNPTEPINIDQTIDVAYEAATPQQWSIKFGELRTAANPDGGYWILLNIDATYRGDNASGSFLDLTVQVTTGAETVDWWFNACPQPPEPVLDLFGEVPAEETRTGVVCLETSDASDLSSVGVAGLIDEPVTIPVG